VGLVFNRSHSNPALTHTDWLRCISIHTGSIPYEWFIHPHFILSYILAIFSTFAFDCFYVLHYIYPNTYMLNIGFRSHNVYMSKLHQYTSAILDLLAYSIGLLSILHMLRFLDVLFDLSRMCA
jgi:hypothetical protein